MRRRLGQREPGQRAVVGEQALSGADGDRVQQQVQLVDQVVRQQRVYELTAAVGEDVLAGPRLERAGCGYFFTAPAALLGLSAGLR